MTRRSLTKAIYSPELLFLFASSFLASVNGNINSLFAQNGLSASNNSAPALNASLVNANQSATPTQSILPGSSSSCVQPALNNNTWIQLGIDNYLANLPNNTAMSLQQYAASVGASNFICGIGEKCQAGQLCSPVQSPGWEVLLAAQEWNNFQNKFYQAVGTAVQIVTTISGALVVDLYPPAHTGGLWDLFSSFNLAAAITVAVVGTLLLFTGVGEIDLPVVFLLLSSLAATSGAIGGIGLHEALKSREPDALDRFSLYAFYLAEWQKHAQKSISNSTRSIITSPVNSPQGISEVLKNGVFFHERPEYSEADIVANLKNTTTVRILTEILRNQGAFVTIASDKCSSKGPGGAWKGEKFLSYCSPNGTMFNIIHSGKKKVHNKWYNADLIYKKYAITVQYLAEQSYYCQLNHGTANFDPYKSGAFPTDLSAECISNLPVCDFRNPEIADAKKEKHTLYACRHVGKLPI